jgi:GNAT superfamily N-acetyltransferase
MRSRNSDLTVEIRPYVDEDEPAVLELLRATLGEGPVGERSHDFFRWKHVANPFGRSFMFVAELEGNVVGLRAFMRWRFHASGKVIPAVNAVDTATHPEYQRLGIFSRLTRTALEEIRREGGFVYNTPNERSLPGYLKMGWKRVGSVPIYVRVARPLRFSRGLRSLDQSFKDREAPPVTASTLSDTLSDGPALSDLLEEDAAIEGRLRTQRSLEYLAWRYQKVPRLDYRAVSKRRGQGLEGLAIFRVRARGRLWEATVSELLVRPGDLGTARSLLREIRRSVRVDHLTCHFPAGSTAARAARRGGFLRSPRGITFVVNDLGQEFHPDPRSFGSWALSLGDLEVF